MVRLASLSRKEALSPSALPLGGVSLLAPRASAESAPFRGLRALPARLRVPLSLEVSSSGAPFTLSCRCETARVSPGALDAAGGSVLVHRDEEATVLRAKLGTAAGARGALGAGGLLGSSSAPSEAELERHTLFSSGFCLGRFLRGLAVGFFREPLEGSGASLHGRALPRGGLGSSTATAAPAPVEGLRGDVSAGPSAEPRRDGRASTLPGESRGDARDGGGSGRFQPAGPRLALEMGTTLRMLSLSEAFKVRTGLGAAPWPRRTLAGLQVPGAASLGGFLFGVAVSFPLADVTLGRPPWAPGSLFTATAGASPAGLDAGFEEETWLPGVVPAPEDSEAPSSPASSGCATLGRESVPSEQSRVREQSVASET